MNQLGSEATTVEEVGVSTGWWRQNGFMLLGVALVALMGGYYLAVIRFQTLVMQPTYTVIPDPYLPLVALLLLSVFVYRDRAFFLSRPQGRWAKTLVVLLSMFVIALGCAGAVREAGYRLPGLKIQINWERMSSLKILVYMQSRNHWCPSGEQQCLEEAEPVIDANMTQFDRVATKNIRKEHWLNYLIVEGAALFAMIAAFLGLHRLSMSDYFKESRYRLLRLFNRYGDES